MNVRYPYKHPRPAAVMVSDVIGLGVCAHQYFTCRVLDFDRQGFAVLMESSDELAVDLESRSTIRRSFHYAWERQRKRAHSVPGYGIILSSGLHLLCW